MIRAAETGRAAGTSHEHGLCAVGRTTRVCATAGRGALGLLISLEVFGIICWENLDHLLVKFHTAFTFDPTRS